VCKIEATLDGKLYISCENDYLIYSSKIYMSSVNPRCVSVKGGKLSNNLKGEK